MRWFPKIHVAENRSGHAVERVEDIFHVATCADLLLLQPSLVTRQAWLPAVDVSIPSISSGQITIPDFISGGRSRQAWSRPFYSIDDGFSYEIRNAVVHRNLGVITTGNYVIFESLWTSPDGVMPDVPGLRWIDGKTLHLPPAPAERSVDFALHAFPRRAGTLAQAHWVTSILPVVGEHLLHGLAKGATVLLPKIDATCQNEMLRLLPVLTEAVTADEDGRIRCDRLVFVPTLFASDDTPHPRGMDIIRHLLVDNGIPQRRERKIYFQRRSPGALEMSNEDEACQTLRAAGFEIHDIDAGGVIERMKLVASAHTIASHHRDGLVAMVFAPPWVRVIEFHRDLDVDWSMRRLSSIVPASYGCLIGRQRPKRIMQSKKDALRNPWLLSIPELQRLLR